MVEAVKVRREQDKINKITMTVALTPLGAMRLAYEFIVVNSMPKVRPWNSSIGSVHHGLLNIEYNINLSPNPSSTNDIEFKCPILFKIDPI